MVSHGHKKKGKRQKEEKKNVAAAKNEVLKHNSIKVKL